jgi:ketosteroid isomerase-like protein
MPDGILGTAYQALGTGDSRPLLALLDSRFEWVEPELPGYPLSGVHRGRDGAGRVLEGLAALFEGFVLEAHEVAEAGERETVTGVMRGRPGGADEDWELPFAHIWEVADDDRFVRVRTYFDRSRLTVAAARRQLADVADDLIEQAAEIRRQWGRLDEAMRAGGAAASGRGGAAGSGRPAPGADDPGSESDDDVVESPAVAAGASARLAAVDMAEEGATREEVASYLRDELEVEEPEPILDEVFGVPGSAPAAATLQEQRAAIVDATRLSRLFARNRG